MKQMMLVGLVALGSVLVSEAFAASCKVESAEKKLAGAAMTSFMKKCRSDARATCDNSAAEKKLSGAAKNSFTKKCVADAVGS